MHYNRTFPLFNSDSIFRKTLTLYYGFTIPYGNRPIICVRIIPRHVCIIVLLQEVGVLQSIEWQAIFWKEILKIKEIKLFSARAVNNKYSSNVFVKRKRSLLDKTRWNDKIEQHTAVVKHSFTKRRKNSTIFLLLYYPIPRSRKRKNIEPLSTR